MKPDWKDAKFTPDDLVEVYAQRRRTSEFLRHCLPTVAAFKQGAMRWNRMVRFQVSVPETTKPAEAGSEGQGA